MRTVKIHDAKTQLSSLLRAVEAGEEVTIARGNTPVARLVPFDHAHPRELGFVHYDVPASFFDPLDDDELSVWER